MRASSSTTGRASGLAARPCWRGAALPDADPPQGAIAFAFWNICGHKQLIHDGKRLTLIARTPDHCQRYALAKLPSTVQRENVQRFTVTADSGGCPGPMTN